LRAAHDGAPGSGAAAPPALALAAAAAPGGRLPCSEAEPLPPAVPCPGRCEDAVYCSAECRDAAWAAHHAALCPAASPALREFCGHADAVNDVFRLAAQVVAGVMLAAERALPPGGAEGATPEARWAALRAAWTPVCMGHKGLWWECVALPPDVTDEAEFRGGECSRMSCRAGVGGGGGGRGKTCCGCFEACLLLCGVVTTAAARAAATAHARTPYAMRAPSAADLRQFACDSLELLAAALRERCPAAAAAFPALLDPRVYGSLIGMFELNNLSLFVAGPVPRWAAAVEELPAAARAAAEAAGGGVLRVLGGIEGILEEEDAWACEGNAFYSLQACANHSCLPNAHAWKREGDRDGAGARGRGSAARRAPDQSCTPELVYPLSPPLSVASPTQRSSWPCATSRPARR
jgi:hypothetical protein